MTQGAYRIRVRGKLDSSRSEWFEGWTIIPEEDGTTKLSGWVADQSALHGVLAKIRNLNLRLIAIHQIGLDHEEGN